MLFTLKSKLSLKSKNGASVLSAGNFDEVTKMVDDMVTIESKEQDGDDKAKPWCNGEFDKSEREEKAEKDEIEDLLAKIEDIKDQIATFQEDIATMSQQIKDLD